eukprot:6446445-Prymnesium_polylepis.1
MPSCATGTDGPAASCSRLLSERLQAAASSDAPCAARARSSECVAVGATRSLSVAPDGTRTRMRICDMSGRGAEAEALARLAACWLSRQARDVASSSSQIVILTSF